MADLLPSASSASGPESDDPRVIGVDSDAADDLLSALSSRTARRILTELHDEPASPAALAERVDSSLQNTQYHLEKLEAAELIGVADTVYSEKGREMKVYVPADRALVVVAGREADTTGLKATLRRLLGGVGVLGVASLLVDRLLGGPTARLFATGGGDGGGAGSDGGNATSGSGGATSERTAGGGTGGDAGAAEVTTSARETTQTAVQTTAETATSTPTPDAETAVTVTETALDGADPTMLDALASSPGLLFFLGGFAVILVGALLLSARR